ncbi:MAG: DUF4445 domain-containing protein [Spirochaetes bacterium]|nr:DUF4445 domain-containing protein [Spirochaetota bacterium]
MKNPTANTPAETVVCVEFIKEKVREFVSPGTTIAEAAERAGIILNLACGQQGTCGKCVVKAEGLLSLPSPEEIGLIGDVERAAGMRLACVAQALGDIRVHVFAVATFTAAKIMEQGEETHVKLAPVIRSEALSLTAPTLEDSCSDITLLERALGQTLCCSTHHIALLPKILRENNYAVRPVYRADDGMLLALEHGAGDGGIYAIAFDIGTTTVVGSLIDMTHGKEIAVASRLNAQHRYGHDVISRIKTGLTAKGLEQLHASITATMNEIIDMVVKTANIRRERIFEIAVAGNTTMLHLLLQVPVDSLAALPFTPVFTRAQRTPAANLGFHIHPEGTVYTLPIVGGFVGADTTACMLSSGMHSKSGISFVVDIGTNGEAAVGNRDMLLTSSAPAGPAFEGAEISCGMRAAPGAIERVVISDDVHINVIGNAAPTGICGSGLIDAIAEMLTAGVISTTGEMIKPDELPSAVPEKVRSRVVIKNGKTEFVLAGGKSPVVITQKDVRELQLAKGAIRSIIELLLKEMNIGLDALETFYIAGAFGNYIRPESAMRIGLIPKLPKEKVRFIGNAALVGAKLSLLSVPLRNELNAFSARAKNMEFAGRPEFQIAFADAMLFPEN